MFNHSKCGGKGCGCGCGCGYSLVGKVLLIVGGLNWGLIGLGMLVGGEMYSWNVVSILLGSLPWLEALVYILVGLAAVLAIFGCRCSKCKACVCESCVPEDKKPEGQM